jgi:hypothetical protein
MCFKCQLQLPILRVGLLKPERGNDETRWLTRTQDYIMGIFVCRKRWHRCCLVQAASWRYHLAYQFAHWGSNAGDASSKVNKHQWCIAHPLSGPMGCWTEFNSPLVHDQERTAFLLGIHWVFRLNNWHFKLDSSGWEDARIFEMDIHI